ncbi:helix-turn-helix transcriptional regulator (plasmid) [Vagococcus sp. JNUCC 83]
MEISKRIKEYRQINKLTQKDLGKILNVSDKTISSWETNRTYPDLELIISISELLDISLDSLLKGDKQVVKNISKDTNFLRKRIILFSVLTFIFSLILTYSFFTLQRGMIVSNKEEIRKMNIIKKDKENLLLELELELPTYKKYKGYMTDVNTSKNEINLILRTQFNIFKPKDKSIEIPLDTTRENKNYIEKVNIVDKEGIIIKTLDMK